MALPQNLDRPADTGLTAPAAAIALAAVVAIAAVARFRGLGDDSLWRDEAVTWFQSRGSIGDVIAKTASDNYPPLHNILVWAVTSIFGDAEWALRLPSAIAGVASVLAIYWIGTLIGTRLTGLIAALLLALSGYDIWFSQEARAYALLLLTATLFAGCALSLLRGLTIPRATAAFVAAVALLYTHTYGVLVWASVSGAVLVVTLLRSQGSARLPAAWIAIQGAAALAFLPWGVILVERAHAIETEGFWIPAPGVTYVAAELYSVASGSITFLLLALAAAAAFIHVRGRDDVATAATLRLHATAEDWILIAWLAGPVILGVGLSVIGTPLFIARYAIGCLPPFLLLAAIGLSRFASGPRSLGAVAAFAVAASAIGIAYGSPPAREDWRSAAPFLADMPGDGCILVPDEGYARVMSYYVREKLPCMLSGPAGAAAATGDLVVAVTSFGSRDIFSALPPETWQNGAPVTQFRGLLIIPFQRVRH
jgi:4-amino-4-deoxy-L-arabinose transferase-like glycosyltransferase